MTRYDEIVKLSNDGETVYDDASPADILIRLAECFAAFTGWKTWHYVRRDHDRREDVPTHEPHTFEDDGKVWCVVQYTIEGKDEFGGATHRFTFSALDVKQTVLVQAIDETATVKPGAVVWHNMLDRMFASLKMVIIVHRSHEQDEQPGA